MTEKQYRLHRLKQINDKIVNRRLILYGIGRNTEAIIEHFKNLNILALIDESRVGKYIYGKKIISFEEALLLNPDIIIIAAEAQSEREIVKRIINECVSNKIQILNMYGIDVIEYFREDLIQDIDYKEITSEKIIKTISASDVVCFELMGVLCETHFYNQESMWRYIEAQYNINQFYNNRLQAEKQKIPSRPYNILDIYSSYLVNTFAEVSETNKICQIEEGIFLDSVFPKDKVLEMFRYSIELGKKVYIVSDLPYTWNTINKILNKVGVIENIPIIQENFGNKTISRGLIRQALNNNLEREILYLGNKNSLGYYISKSYGMKQYMIKNSLEYFCNLTDISLEVESDKLNIFKSWITKEFNSPFYIDNQEKAIEIVDGLNKKDEYQGEDLNLIQFIISDNISDYAPLLVPQYKNIDVSIIIPVYNHFEYTYACLQSIIANTVKVKYEVIIADDCSTDITINISEIIKGIRVIKNTENLLFLKNCNNAARYAKGKYIVFLNNDTQVRYNWLYPLSFLLDKDETIGLVGSKLLFPDGTIQEAGGLIYRDGTAANFGRGGNPQSSEVNYVREVDYISGASIMIRHDLWNEIGGFDEIFTPAYCEDSDLAFEVRKHGRRVVYQPASEVIHFEGVSNGKNISDGIKKYQEINISKLRIKWKDILINQSSAGEKEEFAAKDRKQGRKTVLFISGTVPTYDRDAGSKTIMSYLKLFMQYNYIVKFWPTNMYATQPYTLELQQMGIEVLYGSSMKNKMSRWLFEHQKDIDYAFIHYPSAGSDVIDLLKMTSIRTRYYGHDLHYLRLKREYDLTKDKNCLLESDLFYKREKEIISKADYVYYPANNEIEIVKKEFGKKNAKQISPYMYDDMDPFVYEPQSREGIMFIGGSHGPNEDAVLWFLSEIYPDIYNEKKIPFYLVGADQSAIIKQIKNDGIRNIGYVTDDELTDLYHKIRMVVIPLRYGAGIKGKVVDAMYHKVPIVSTSVGIEGIQGVHDCVEIVDTAHGFRDSILNLYDNYRRLVTMSEQYSKIIDKDFSVSAAWKKIERDFV